jgi:hypothetical protein
MAHEGVVKGHLEEEERFLVVVLRTVAEDMAVR